MIDIVVEFPPSYQAERRYVLSVLLEDYLGLTVETRESARSDTLLTVPGTGRTLHVADGLFACEARDWLLPASLPGADRPGWRLPDSLAHGSLHPTAPVVYGMTPEDPSFFHASETHTFLGLDIFGTCFFFLTRYEEAVPDQERDRHERMPASASFAGREGLLNRPLVNEYLEILWACMRRLWPGLERRTRAYLARITHDVDWPLCVRGRSPAWVCKNVAADLAVRRDPALAARRLAAFAPCRSGDYDPDPCNTFDDLMDLSEKHALASAFNFIAERTAGMIDGIYDIEDPWIKRLIHRVHARGHEVGLHPSYMTFRDPAQTAREFRRLRRLCEELGVDQPRWGGRQHYLRWDNPHTWQNWEDAGLDYDSTLMFPGRVGFRCGTCYPYHVFNLRTRKELKLVEEPLTVMDRALVGDMCLRSARALETVGSLAEVVKHYAGTFCLLWHNSNFISRAQRRLYVDCLSAIL